jgi:hypothetical protein
MGLLMGVSRSTRTWILTPPAYCAAPASSISLRAPLRVQGIAIEIVSGLAQALSLTRRGSHRIALALYASLQPRIRGHGISRRPFVPKMSGCFQFPLTVTGYRNNTEPQRVFRKYA